MKALIVPAIVLAVVISGAPALAIGIGLLAAVLVIITKWP